MNLMLGIALFILAVLVALAPMLSKAREKRSVWLRNGDRVFEVSDAEQEARLRAEGFENCEEPGSDEDLIDSLPPVGGKTPSEYLSNLTVKHLLVVAKTEGVDAKGLNKSELVNAILAKTGYTSTPSDETPNGDNGNQE